MNSSKFLSYVSLLSILGINCLYAQTEKLTQQVEQSMLRATKYMVEEVSTHGGFLWTYTPDFSRQWGEREAYKTMIWVQGGTVSVGHMLLDAYKATGNEYYYQAAEKAADALIWGQSSEGGWNYLIDFAGDQSLKKWYSTIGKNGWGPEEFHYYYGNSTFDDETTTGATRFILRIYLEKLDTKYKPALDKAINFILKSQYPIGGWPQRYPLKYENNKVGRPDYTSFHTYNDGVISDNIDFLIQCYQVLGEERFLDPIIRGMNFFIITQQGSGAWGQQYNMRLEPASARTYEPAALLPRATFTNALTLLRFYEYTGDDKFISRVPDAIRWLEKTRLPQNKTENGRYSHSTFVEVGTDRPIYAHRKGSNVTYGFYYIDYNDSLLLGHYGGKGAIDIDILKEEYKRVSAMTPAEATKNSPLLPKRFQEEGIPQTNYIFRPSTDVPDISKIKEIISSLDDKNRWLIKHARISNPYIGTESASKELTDRYTSNPGDKTDLSPFIDPSEQDYISTAEYVRNMDMLIAYIISKKNKQPQLDR